MRQKQDVEAINQTLTKPSKRASRNPTAEPVVDNLIGRREKMESQSPEKLIDDETSKTRPDFLKSENGKKEENDNLNDFVNGLSPEQMFTNELALETARTAGKEMFEFEFLFNQTENYKQSYYCRKFECDASDYESLIAQIKRSYITGIIWNYNYYYKYCVSWTWFYPYYYAPLISDLCNFSTLNFEFERGRPLRPFEQLLAVLPPYSSHALPSCFKPLMTEELSEIIDFYPEDFYVDLAGKRFAWLGEVILPFIDDDRLKQAFASIEGKLSDRERERNRLGRPVLMFLEDKVKVQGTTEPTKLGHIFSLSHFLQGLRSNTAALRVFYYELPSYVAHKSALLNGLRLPKSEFYCTV